MSGLFNRGVPAQGRITKIACSNPSFDGTMYSLMPGEVLGRSIQPGRENVDKDCRCAKCGLTRTLTIQVRKA